MFVSGPAPRLCHPDGSGLEFPKPRYCPGDVCGSLDREPHEVRQRHQTGQEIRGRVGEGPAVSLGRHANPDKWPRTTIHIPISSDTEQ
jgi:hypothetical protein